VTDKEHRLFGRTRRSNAPEGDKRDQVVKVTVTGSEKSELVRRAAFRKVSVPRLLIDAAMNQHIETDDDRKQAIRDLWDLRRQFAGFATNVNQIAKFANEESTFPAEAQQAMTQYRELYARIDDVVSRLAGA
jgi:hypothetical protein